MAYEQIGVEDRGAVRVITLNRPEKLNAWTRRMHHEMAAAVVEGNDSSGIGAFVFTGAGRAFCAGADIGAEFEANLESDRDDQSGEAAGASANSSSPDSSSSDSASSDSASSDSASSPDATDWVGLVRSSKPMVAAINGPSIGVGLTMVLPMDFLMVTPDAKLSARFVKMGLVPELASSHFLVQRCGWGAASDLALSGRMVLGEEARAIGLVDEVVAGDALVEAAISRADSYAENPAPALRMIKELLTQNGSETDLRAAQRREVDALNRAFTTPEHKEAVSAFMERREPKFR